MNAKANQKWALYDTQPSFVLGFHGCDRSIGEKILSGQEAHLFPSKNDYDWLGHGIYFWEANPQRAWGFALEATKNQKISRGSIQVPFVIGAIINLGTCLNLTNSASLQQVKSSYELLSVLHTLIPETEKPKKTPAIYSNAN